MKLKFEIDKTYTITHALHSVKEPFKGFDTLKDRLWKQNKPVFYFLSGLPELFLFKNSRNTENIAKQSKEIVKELMKIEEIKRLLRETEEYLESVKKQWKVNERIVLKTIQDLSGLSLPQGIIKVFITHPKLNNGIYAKKNVICWGHPEEWKNYTSVYLAHEILHIMTEEKIDSPIMHSIIELLADNELRIRLNRKGNYLEVNGHDNKLNKKIFPIWKDYLLNRKQKNILELEEMIRD